MTVSSQITKTGPTAGPGTIFPYGFRILDEADVEVTLTLSTGVNAILTLAVDYTVQDVGEVAGGTVTLTVAATSGETITCRRVTPFTQPYDPSNQGSWLPENHETAYDRLTHMVQQLGEKVARCFRVGVDENPDPGELVLDDWLTRPTLLAEVVVSDSAAVANMDLTVLNSILSAYDEMELELEVGHDGSGSATDEIQMRLSTDSGDTWMAGGEYYYSLNGYGPVSTGIQVGSATGVPENQIPLQVPASSVGLGTSIFGRLRFRRNQTGTGVTDVSAVWGTYTCWEDDPAGAIATITLGAAVTGFPIGYNQINGIRLFAAAGSGVFGKLRYWGIPKT